MFEALFILTTVDAGTRIARFILQELLGSAHGHFKRADWLPGNLLASALVVLAWGFLIWNASINTIWPMFGIANQLLASIALAVATTALITAGKARYAWTTAVPFVFVSITTLTAAYQMISNHYWPKSATLFMIRFNITLIVLPGPQGEGLNRTENLVPPPRSTARRDVTAARPASAAPVK